jgi:hypothetical protein
MVTGMPARSVQSALAEFSFDIRAGCSSRQRSNHSWQGRHLALENIGPFSRIAEFPYLTGAAPFHFVLGHNFGLFLINRRKELPYIVKQEIGLFKSSKVPTPRHFSLLYYVVSLSNPAKRRDSYLLRKIRIRHRSLQAWRSRCLFSSEPVLAIDSHGGAHRVCNPVESDVGQKCVAVHSRKKIAVVVRKQLKFAYHPGQPPNRRVSQGVGKSLRLSGLEEKKLLSGRLKYAFRFRSASLICATASGFGGSAVMRFR